MHLDKIHVSNLLNTRKLKLKLLPGDENHPVRWRGGKHCSEDFCKGKEGKEIFPDFRPKAARNVISKKWDLNQKCPLGKMLNI